MIFGKRATICDDAKSSSDELSFTDFCDGTEPDVTGHTISVTSARVREVVNNTGLFSGRSDNQMGWSHWSFAEYLAAHYLAIRSLDTTQVLSLITQPSGSVCEIRRVVPQLRETAGWLCAMRPEFIEHFIQGDPEILLRSAEISLDETLRQKVVQSLLEKVKTGWRRPAEPFVRRDYSNLAYPGLADQLRPYICDKQEDIRVREVASEIAEHCNVRQLLPELTKVALDSCETPHMRSAAAHHVVRFNDETYILKLRPLLKLSSAEDPDRDLMGMALRALWPDHTTASELFEHLLIAPKPSYYGAYAIFLHRLPATLTSEQLPIVLKWAINQPQDHLLTLEFGQLIARAIYMACEHIDVDGVLPALVQLFVARLQRCDPLMPPCLDANVEPQFKHSAALRQRIMDAIIDQLPISDQFITVKVEELCLPEDVPWLVGRIILTSGGVRDRWFACLMAAYDYSTSMQLDAILDGMRQSEYLKTRLQQRFAPIELNSKEGQKIKADYLRHQRLIHRPRRQKPMLPQQLEDILKKHLDEAEAGNLDAWWRMNLDMTVCPPTAQYPLDAEFQSDLTELPGWKLLDPQDRERSVQVAATYLQDGEPNDSLWLGKNVLHRPAAAGYRAIRLLKKEAPAILKSLPAALWRKWTTIIVAFPEGNRLIDNDDLTEITALAYQAARDAIIDALKVMIKKENKELGHIFVLRRMERCWDKFLAQTILQYVHEEPLKMESVGDVFSELLKHQPANAVEVIEFFQSLRQIEPTDYLLSAKLAAVLLTYAPHKAWTSVWLTMRLNDEFGKAVITNLATQHDHNCAGNIATHIDETDVAQFYVYISRLFPHAQDPHFEETHAVQAREAIGMFRDGILRALQDRGTLGACKAIDHIIAKLPKLTWMKYVRPVAVEAMLKETWHGQSPKTIFALVESKERRVIENGTQLLDALTESLRRLEKTLHGATPSVGDLWDERSKQPKNENRLSDYLKRHFENDLKGRGIVVNREVEIRKPIAGKGQNTDILVQAFRSNDPHDLHDPISVIIEIKGCWNRALKTSMKTQLKDRYLKKNNQCQHGLYLIGWFNCSKWSRNDYRKKQTPRWSIIKAREHFERQADDLSLQGGIELRAFVLNAGLNQ